MTYDIIIPIITITNILLIKMKTQDNRLHTVHQLDSIYYGQLNSSYQKDSFGIQQTFEFDTYMGYWKNNKT